MRRYIYACLLAFILPMSADMQIKGQPHPELPDGFEGSIGFGKFHLDHPDRFFSTLSGHNLIIIPQMNVSEQMMLGNTLRIGRGWYFLNGILYGSQQGTMGNNWGMGTREGFMWRPGSKFSILIWSQYYQSVAVYMPIMFYPADHETAALKMPATPEVFSFGVQASFLCGDLIIGVGTSVAPVPFQKRHHSEFRYR